MAPKENGCNTIAGRPSKEALDYFIFGHRHLPLDLEVTPVAGSRHLNCGDWIRHRSYVTLDEGGATLHHWT